MLSSVAGDTIPRLPDEGDAQYELRQEFINQQLQSLAQMVNDLDEIVIGGTIDAEARKLIVDFSVTAVPGSELAEQLAAGSGLNSRFAGFVVDDATLSANINTQVAETDAGGVVSMLNALRAQLESTIGEDALPQEVADVAHGVIDEFMELAFVETIKAGRIDVGVTLLGEGPYTVCLGAHVPKRDELVKFFDNLVEQLENEVGFYGIQKNVAEHAGVTFHNASVPIPGGDLGELLTSLFGNELEVVIGFGEDSLYVAIGADGLESLKAAIDRSAQLADTETPPIRAELALAPLLDSLSAIDAADASLSNFALNVEPGKDRVTVVGESIENGFKIHVEAEEGIVAMIGSFFQMLVPQVGGLAE